MNREYVYEIPINLFYDFAEDKTSIHTLPQSAQVVVAANGWKLLKVLLIERNIHVAIPDAESKFIFHTNENSALFSKKLPSGVNILSVQPDSIVVFSDEKISRKMKVAFMYHITTADTSLQVSEIQLTPDSITVSGPKSVVEKFTTWKTGLLYKENLQDDITGVISLLQNDKENITLSAVAVQYEVKIEKFIQKEFEIRPDYDVYDLPLSFDTKQTITVRCKVPVSKTDSLSEGDFQMLFKEIRNDTLFLSEPAGPAYIKDLLADTVYIVRKL